CAREAAYYSNYAMDYW
nr:immunoglobulin heavy chain junction region [Mus musculus]NSM03703.1 immunoglobulin heavy chain junction region [Mus musculus]NSM03736.1 immunoglobulin heavy chain junction region [Mus musculus]NSM03772.1 immunoglobulin heavy chain junction region [Mus musculus]NSM03842.1 immunoglobulin heavy chain junction region [Mus musculus]